MGGACIQVGLSGIIYSLANGSAYIRGGGGLKARRVLKLDFMVDHFLIMLQFP